MKKSLVYLTIAILAALMLVSCDKNKGKTKDPLNATTWTALDGDYLMVLKFDMGTRATFYVGDRNLERLGQAYTSLYTLTDDTKISFVDLKGKMGTYQVRFKSGQLDGDSMLVTYYRQSSMPGGLDGPEERYEQVFKKSRP